MSKFMISLPETDEDERITSRLDNINASIKENTEAVNRLYEMFLMVRNEKEDYPQLAVEPAMEGEYMTYERPELTMETIPVWRKDTYYNEGAMTKSYGIAYRCDKEHFSAEVDEKFGLEGQATLNPSYWVPLNIKHKEKEDEQ